MSIVTPDWVRDAVFYQVFPDRLARSGRVEAPGPLEDWDAPPTIHGFKGGDLYGVADRLDDLADLGITAIYLTPVFASASNHRYHTYDYFRVDPLLGGDAALRALLDAAHERGMRVILDGVFNHASRGFWAFNHILECGLASPYLDWFRVDREALAQGRPLRAYPDESLRHAAGGDGGPDGFGTETSFSLGYDAWWNMPALPKLNTDNPQVREYLMRVAEHWIRFGSDGWRLDVAAEIDDDEFWREFRRRVKGLNPDAYIVAEVWNEDHRWLQGDQFDAYMNYQLAFAILSFAAGDHRDQSAIDAHMDVRAGIRHDDGWGFLHRVEHQLRTYDPDVVAVQLNLLGSHDTARIRTICGDDLAAVRLATLAQLTLPGAPCIYYGDEIGMAGGHEPASRAAYPADEEAGDRELRAFVRAAIRLRHEHAALRRGWFAPLAADGMAAAYRRGDDVDGFVVCLNAGEGPATLHLNLPDLDGRTLATVAPDGWAWPAADPARVVDGWVAIDLPARGARLLHVVG